MADQINDLVDINAFKSRSNSNNGLEINIKLENNLFLFFPTVLIIFDISYQQ